MKFLIFKSIRTHVLDYFDFEFIVSQTVNLVNKRPIAFKDGLRSLLPDEIPVSITPELLLKGYECTPINIIPQMQPNDSNEDPTWNNGLFVKTEYAKISRVRAKLLELYHQEFLTTLIYQAVDKPDRYKKFPHQCLKPGDLVLLSDKLLKRYHYPMGKVLSVEINSLGEATAAKVIKGDSREVVYRHVNSLILLLPAEEDNLQSVVSEGKKTTQNPERVTRKRSQRKAAIKCRGKIMEVAKSL